MNSVAPDSDPLLHDLRILIGQSRQQVASVINAENTRLYSLHTVNQTVIKKAGPPVRY